MVIIKKFQIFFSKIKGNVVDKINLIYENHKFSTSTKNV